MATTSLTATTIGGVGGHPRPLAWTDFNVIACCLLFSLQN